MPIPLGPVMKAWWSWPSSRVRITHHLPGVVDARSTAVAPVPPKVPRSLIPIPLGPVMKAWTAAPPAVCRITHHLPGVVDAMSLAVSTAQSAKVSHAHPVGARDESMRDRLQPCQSQPTTCPASLMPLARLISHHPKVPRSLIPIPSGPVMKAWESPPAV